LQTAKARAEARLEALHSAGVNVDEWLAENVHGDDGDDDAGEADDSTADGRLSPTISARSDLSDRVSTDLLGTIKKHYSKYWTAITDNLLFLCQMASFSGGI